MPKVFVSAPVRNRAWVLPRHLRALLKQTDVDKQFLYVVNDCDDNTEEVLQEFGIPYVHHDMGKMCGHVRGQYSYQNLAELRNRVLDEFLKTDCDYLFSIDTDVIIEEGSLRKLIEDDKDIVSMIIRNHPTIMAHNVMIDDKHLEVVPEGLIPCDLTGAVYLIKRKVIEAGVRYGYTPRGEDFPFCWEAKNKGFELYCDTRIKAVHAYAEGVDLIAKVG